MSATYFGILTKVGEAKEANAKALGIPISISELAVGDGGGVLPTPNREQTALVGLKRRKLLNSLYVDPNNPNYLIAEQVIPEGEGGWWIRELGLYDKDGDLIAVANCPPSYKPQLAEGSGRTQAIRMVLMVASTATFELKIDPSIVLATREELERAMAKKLDIGGTAVAAKKLESARTIKFSGVVSGQASFDGSKDIEVKATFGDEIVWVPYRAAIPAEKIGDLIVVKGWGELEWVKTAYFEGYRSPHCGRPLDGHTALALAREVDAVGGLASKTAYAGLWGYAREQGLTLTQAQWDAKNALGSSGHFFVDFDATQFRLPNLRNQHRRYTGTDLDTANARTMGSMQRDANRIPYNIGRILSSSYAWLAGSTNGYGYLKANEGMDGMSAGPETRPLNTAYHPRIHA